MSSPIIHILLVNTDSKNEKELIELREALEIDKYQLTTKQQDNIDEYLALPQWPEKYDVVIIRQLANDKALWKRVLTKAKLENPSTEIMVINTDDTTGQDAGTVLNSGAYAYFIYPKSHTLPGYIRAAVQRAEVRNIRREFSGKLNQTQSVEQVAELLIDTLSKLVGYDKATVVLLNKSTSFQDTWTRSIIHPSYSTKETDWELLRPISPHEGHDNFIYEILTNKKPKIFPLIRNGNNGWDLARKSTESIRSWLAIPLFYDEEPIALVTLDSATEGYYDYDRVNESTLELIANQAATALKNITRHMALTHLEGAFKEVAANTGPNLDDILKSIATMAGKLVGGTFAYVCIAENNGNFLRIRPNWTWASLPNDKDYLEQMIDDLHGGFFTQDHEIHRNFKGKKGITTLAYQLGQPVLLGDIKNLTKVNYDDKTASDAYMDYAEGSMSDLAVPILDIKAERHIGVINVEHPYPFAITPQHIESIKELGQFAATAIEKSADHNRTIKAGQRLEALLAAGAQVTSHIAYKDANGLLDTTILLQIDRNQLTHLLKVIANHGWEAAKVSWVAVNIYEKGQFIYDISRSAREGIRSGTGTMRTDGPSHSRWAMWKKEPVIISNIEEYEKKRKIDPEGCLYHDPDSNEPIPVNPQTYETGEAQAVLCTPLLLGEKAIGVIWFHYKDVHYFDEYEVENLKLFARLAATVIHQATLYNVANSRIKSFDQIHKISSDDQAGKQWNWGQVLLPYLTTSVVCASAIGGAIYIDSRTKDQLRRMISYNIPAKDRIRSPLRSIKYGDGVVGRAFREGIYQVSNYPKWSGKITDAPDLGSTIGIRINDPYRQRPLGVLFVNREVNKSYAPDEIARLEEQAHELAPLLAIIRDLSDFRTIKPYTKKSFVFIDRAFTRDPSIETAIKLAAKAVGLEAKSEFDITGNDPAFQGGVSIDIQENLRQARFVIADISIDRPNVYWEHGFAWAIAENKVITIIQQGIVPAFDIADVNRIEFSTSENLRLELIKRLKSKLAFEDGAPEIE